MEFRPRFSTIGACHLEMKAVDMEPMKVKNKLRLIATSQNPQVDPKIPF
jgi:hypothetical protein